MSKGIDNETILDAVRERQPATTTEIGEVVGIARQSAGYRLRQLEETGEVRCKKVGQARIWMLGK